MITLQNLPEEIKSFLLKHNLLTDKKFADEQPAGLQRALAPVTDVVMRGLAELAGQANGRELVWQAASGVPTPSTSQTAGTGLIKSVLDDRFHGTVNTITKETGLTGGAVTQLIEVVTAAALRLLGSLAAEQHWNAQQLGEWLRPRQFAPVAPLPVAPAPALAAAAPVAAGSSSWFATPANALLVAVSIIAASEFGYILSTRPGTESTVVASAAGEPAVAAGQYAVIPVANLSAARPTDAAHSKTAVPVVLKLKNGVRQIIGAQSTESKLYQFLIDPSKEVDLVDPTKDWIGFDRIYFDSNKATLTNESLWQLSNVASILKRFPKAKIKIGGYTDSSGNPLSNLRLSKERAQAAMTSLVSLGVPADRLTSAGYGAIDNIASNDTEEGRALNRRVSLQVTQK